METPTPVNLSALQALLAKSKQIMNVVESTKPVKQVDNSKTSSYDSYGDTDTRPSYGNSYDNEYYNERDEREMNFDNGYSNGSSFSTSSMYTEEQVRASNFSPAVKEALLKYPSKPMQSPLSKVSPEQILKMSGGAKPINENRNSQPRTNSDMITVSRSELKEMINEGISTFFKQIYDKTLTEETIKKTINVLIKEGKINIKKKQ